MVLFTASQNVQLTFHKLTCYSDSHCNKHYTHYYGAATDHCYDDNNSPKAPSDYDDDSGKHYSKPSYIFLYMFFVKNNKLYHHSGRSKPPPYYYYDYDYHNSGDKQFQPHKHPHGSGIGQDDYQYNDYGSGKGYNYHYHYGPGMGRSTCENT